MRLIIELSQTAQGRLEGSVACPDSGTGLSFEGVVELVGVLEQHLRAEVAEPALPKSRVEPQKVPGSAPYRGAARTP
jgi:hypothetical protein